MRSDGDQVVLVCGGRGYDDRVNVFDVLDRVHRKRRIGLLVHGAATGADTLAESWAKKRQVMYLGVPAPWNTLGRSAGPTRNSYMLERAKPDLVVGFPGGVGTSDMLQKARHHNVSTVNADSCDQGINVD